MARLLNGAEVTEALDAQTARGVGALKAEGVAPKLAILRVGGRDDDLSYERGAVKRAAAVGVEVEKTILPVDCTQGELMDAIARINADGSIHGCLMFRPLPGHLDEEAACAALDPAKDVDGITAGSLYGVFANREVGFPPCTADACMQVLAHYGYDLAGANVTVVGRSLVIGKPVSMMLQAANATVTMCHTRTRDLAAECRRADILVVAVGRAGTVRAEHVREGQVVVDVGINWDAEAGKLVGDVAFDEVEPIVEAVTPVPGGVGGVTTSILCKHVVEAAAKVHGL